MSCCTIAANCRIYYWRNYLVHRNLTENRKTSGACRSVSRPQHTRNTKRFMRYSLIARRRCQLFRWRYAAKARNCDVMYIQQDGVWVCVLRFAPVFVASTAAATAWLVLVPPWERPRRTSLAPSAWRSAAVGWRHPVTHQLLVSLVSQLLSFLAQRDEKPLLLAPKHQEKSKR